MTYIDDVAEDLVKVVLPVVRIVAIALLIFTLCKIAGNLERIADQIAPHAASKSEPTTKPTGAGGGE